jgi:hypothetical protein
LFIIGFPVAVVLAWAFRLGDKTKAIDYLKRGYRNHDAIDTTGIRVDAMLDLRRDPRFETLADKAPEITTTGQPKLSKQLRSLLTQGAPVFLIVEEILSAPVKRVENSRY